MNVTKDPKEAVKWYKMSANNGDINAQYSLACVYTSGEGIEVDLMMAYKWFYQVSKRQLDSENAKTINDAKNAYISIEPYLSKDQIANAQKMVDEIIK
jgi:TPR repeat protein